MKTQSLFVLIIFTLMSFIIFGCQKDVSVTEPECSDCPAKSGMVSLDKSGDEFKVAVRSELEKIAKHLAQNRVAVSNSLPAKVFERDGETVLSELAIASALPKQFLRKDGREFEVNFALAKKSPAENIASQLRVTSGDSGSG